MTSSALTFAGYSGNDAAQAPNPPATQPILNSDVMEVPISTTEADRFQTVIATEDGPYYAVGFVTLNGDRHMAVACLGSTSELDPSFGQNGIATVNVAVGGKTAEIARGVVIQSGGKIVITDLSSTIRQRVGTLRGIPTLQSSGRYHGTLGSDIRNQWDYASRPQYRSRLWHSLSRRHILGADTVVRRQSLGGRWKARRWSGSYGHRLCRREINRNWPVNTTFGTNGRVTLDVEQGGDNPRTAIVQPDGNIVVSSHTSGTNAVVTTVLFRLLANGQFDSSFGKNGVVNVALLASFAEAYDVALQGQNLVISDYGKNTSTDTVDIISARFSPGGTWDKTYGENGVAVIDVAGQDDRSRTLQILPDQSVLIVEQGKPTATTQDGALVLLTPNGQRDTRLNGNGVALIDFGGPTDALFGLALSPDKTKAVAVGWKGVDTTAVSPTNTDDARIVHFSLPQAQ